MSSTSPRRSYGTGSLEIRKDKHGREVYYGRFYAGHRQIRRKLGLKRQGGQATGLTKPAAERALQKLIDEQVRLVPVAERVDLKTAGERYILHLREVMRRKPSTVQDYEIMLRKHLVPFFGSRSMDRIDTHLVCEYLVAKQRGGLASKTVGNQLTFLHGLFRHAMKKGWVYANPVAAVDRPRDPDTDADIRFLTYEEVEALLRAVPQDSDFGGVDRPLYLTAITTGLRQGELVALRWRDVDWSAGVIRVRVSYSCGEWGTPKSRRSSRAVPIIDRTAAALDELYRQSAFRRDDALVFGHPGLGSVLDTSKLRKRFKATLTKAEIRPVRFHDLRHTFGTQAAAAGVPLRTLQEWMGHRDYKTTLIYADYAPRTHEKSLMERAFSPEPPRFPDDAFR
jgi:integrase